MGWSGETASIVKPSAIWRTNLAVSSLAAEMSTLNHWWCQETLHVKSIRLHLLEFGPSRLALYVIWCALETNKTCFLEWGVVKRTLPTTSERSHHQLWRMGFTSCYPSPWMSLHASSIQEKTWTLALAWVGNALLGGAFSFVLELSKLYQWAQSLFLWSQSLWDIVMTVDNDKCRLVANISVRRVINGISWSQKKGKLTHQCEPWGNKHSVPPTVTHLESYRLPFERFVSLHENLSDRYAYWRKKVFVGKTSS